MPVDVHLRLLASQNCSCGKLNLIHTIIQLLFAFKPSSQETYSHDILHLKSYLKGITIFYCNYLYLEADYGHHSEELISPKATLKVSFKSKQVIIINGDYWLRFKTLN